MPSQDAQGRWISDDGRSYWDGAAWKPLQSSPAPAYGQQPPAPGYGQQPPAPGYGQQPQQAPAGYAQPSTPSYGPPPSGPLYGPPGGFAQQPPSYAPAGYPAPMAQPRRSGLAIASLVLGIASLIFWLLPILGLPVAIAGIVTGVMARSGSRRGMALAGLICSIIGLVLTIINGAVGAYLAVQNSSHFFSGLL